MLPSRRFDIFVHNIWDYFPVLQVFFHRYYLWVYVSVFGSMFLSGPRRVVPFDTVWLYDTDLRREVYNMIDSYTI